MNKTPMLFLFLCCACQGVFSAKNHDEGAIPVQGRESQHGETVACTQVVVQSVKHKDGSVDRTSTETKNQINRQWQEAHPGLPRVMDATGEVSFTVTDLNHSNQVLSSSDYTYTIHRESQTAAIPDGSIRETSSSRTTKTGKNGYQLVNEKGEKVSTLSELSTDEVYTRLNGGRRYRLSARHNGKDLPPAQYVTEVLSTRGNYAAEHTWLAQPLVTVNGTDTQTLEKDETNCQISAPQKSAEDAIDEILR